MKLFSGTAPAAGDVVTHQNKKGQDFISVQSTTATSCTAVIQGRMGADHDWQDLVTLTDSSADTVAWFSQYRANVTACVGQTEVDIAGR